VDTTPLLAEQIEQLIGVLHTRPRSGERSLQEWTKNGGVTVPQMATLSILHERGPMTLSELAAASGISLSAASQLIDRMVKRGLVSREDDPANRRRSQLTATSRSKTLLERISKARRSHFESALDELPSDLRRELSRVLERVLKAYEENEDGAETRRRAPRGHRDRVREPVDRQERRWSHR
jgi:DNA-binding MarR family transcriptional regulator